MRLIGTQENLKRGLGIVGHTTTKNINLPILNNILIRALDGNIELVGTNLEIGITYRMRGKIEEDGDFTVDSRLITEYVNLLGLGEKVRMEEVGGELRVESGNYKTKIKGEAAKEFPLIPTIVKNNPYTCSPKDLKKALDGVVFASSNNENRIELTGVLFSFFRNKLTLAATDSYRLAEKEIEIKGGSQEELKIIAPTKTVQELLRALSSLDDDVEEAGDGVVNVYLSENQILFSFGSVDIISRLISGHYPDYKQIIPAKIQTEALVDKGEFSRAVKAASLFSKNGINDINLQFSKKRIKVSSFSGISGESEVDVEAEIGGPENEISINYRYLLDGLNNIDGDQVKIGIVNSNTPCLLKPAKESGYLYIIMPIRQ